MRRLVLMRHGRSPFDTSVDFDRRLDGEGRNGAATVARALAETGFRPDLVIASAALRAAETARVVAEILKPREVCSEDELYLAPAQMIQSVVEDEADTADSQSILVIGHNPGISEFGAQLDPDASELAPSEAYDFEFDFEDWGLVLDSPIVTKRHHKP
jgi:phosphohistidine phosphatase